MRSACIVMTVIFAQFAYFQRNDLDQFNTEIWYVWIVIYGVCSALSLVSYFRALSRGFYLSFGVASFVGALIRVMDVTPGVNPFFNDNNPAGNEAGGLVVIALWFTVLFWRHESLITSKS